MATSFRAPTPREFGRLEHTLVAAKSFADAQEMRAAFEHDPWRIKVNDRGDVAVLARWRDHLPVLAIEALWCPTVRIPDAVTQFRRLGEEMGLTDVVSPPTPVEEARPYEVAGMHPYTVVTTYTLARLAGLRMPTAPAELVIREADHRDLETLIALDAACFEPFWRYDARHLSRFIATARLAVASLDGEPVGYTLCTIDGDDGLLGRLCVTEPNRRRGIGAALLFDAARFINREGGLRMTLSTQVDNHPSQALYRSASMQSTGHRYAFLRFGP